MDPALQSTSSQTEPNEENIHPMSDWLEEARMSTDELKKKLEDEN